MVSCGGTPTSHVKQKSASLRMMRAKWEMEGKGKDSGMVKGVARGWKRSPGGKAFASLTAKLHKSRDGLF